MSDLVHKICQWQQAHGRHNLPWQQTQDPYKVWLSEIMLQQTQVATVIAYYEKFLNAFPRIEDLAHASSDQVMGLWAGLGYYARARNLHKTAHIVLQEYAGQFPQEESQILALPGIGLSTAHAIMAFCFNKRVPIMDGNVKRIFCRYFGISGHPSQSRVEKKLWQIAEDELKANQKDKISTYTQGLMDLGATVCKRKHPDCELCPLQADCYAFQHELTESLPSPKAKTQIPTRSKLMLIVVKHNKVLLEKRAEDGIWGGLMSFPEFDETEQLHHYLNDKRIDTALLQMLAPFSHTFSHFKLQIHPYLINMGVDVSDPPRLAESSLQESYIDSEEVENTREMVWLDLDERQQAPIPRPVSKLLEQISTVELF